ncbi:MAG: hypothetical protein JST48_06965 [Bacteroidetes bacterium]|nr:hypothetical protein [Bacteroidota bacterium]
MKKVTILSMVLTVASFSLPCQDKPLAFYDIIANDSIRMYFDPEYHFTEKPCAQFIRYIRVNDQGDFNGYFADATTDGSVIGTGRYINGKRHGHFETYYPNGKIKRKGEYRNNLPVGDWEFYYDSGLPERTLKITDSDTLLIRYIDKKGNLLVQNGKGKFKGTVEASGSVIAKGKIVNGKPDRKWKSTYSNNAIFCEEKFKNGKLIKGIFPTAIPGANRYYYSQSLLSAFLFADYVTDLEKYQVKKCTDSILNNNEIGNRPIDHVQFRRDLYNSVKIISDNNNGFKRVMSNVGYTTVLNAPVICIRFETNEKREPINFQVITDGGHEYLGVVSSLLMKLRNFPPKERIFFFFQIDRSGMSSTLGNNLLILYYFSKERAFDASKLRK